MAEYDERAGAVARRRAFRVLAPAALIVGAAGYAATELLNSSAAPARPPSPYGSQSAPDCDPPEKNPVPCDAYEMTCEEKAAYHRRRNAEEPGHAHVVLCDTFRAESN
ncbi:hypothetical protein AB0C77_28960 [Streptomyces sp. NPDC048629]|uniref:hypothetical protein n=1 Tax=Streptomyces sp. NPDC048629 TaxID=3154824 RepID=UPI00343E3198